MSLTPDDSSTPTPSPSPALSPSKTKSAAETNKPPVKSSGRQENSPVTGIIDEKQVIIDFGKYEGKSVYEMSQTDSEYYDRLVAERETGAFAIRRNKDKTFYLYINPLSKTDH